eukprot:g8895.t1
MQSIKHLTKIFIIFTILFCCLSDAKTAERDILALKLLKKEVENRDPFWKGVVSTWGGGGPNGEDDPCGNGWKSTWDGIECRYQGNLADGLPRVVTNIHVTDSGVTGPIPLSISLLEDLVEIDLDGNRISGPLNPYIGCLSGMRELDLANNSLSGTIPTEWRWMTNLEEVELETNPQLTGCIPQGMPPVKTVCREDTPEDAILNPGRPLCELVGTIVFDTAVGGFCPQTPAIEKRCPDVAYVKDFIQQGMPYDLYYQSQANSATVTPVVREIPVVYENGARTDVYAELDPDTNKVRLRRPVRRDSDVDVKVVENITPPRRVTVAAPQSSAVNRRSGLLGFVSSLFAQSFLFRALSSTPISFQHDEFQLPSVVDEDITLFKEQELSVSRRHLLITSDPQMTPQYQLLYQSTCWEDVERALASGPILPSHVELAWNILKQLPHSHLIPVRFLDDLAFKTIGVVDQMTERCYASVWHGTARLQFVNYELIQALVRKGSGTEVHDLNVSIGGTESATRVHNSNVTIDGTFSATGVHNSNVTKFFMNFSPRHLTNVVYSIARLHRRVELENGLSEDGEAFPMEAEFFQGLIRELFRKRNELNEQDLSNVSLAMGLVGYQDRPGGLYKELLEEVESKIHLKRFTEQDLANICFGLTYGGGLDLFKDCNVFIKEVLDPYRSHKYHIRTVSLLIRCLTMTSGRHEKAPELLHLFQRVCKMDALQNLTPLELRSVLLGLGLFKIQDWKLWSSVSEFFFQQDNTRRFSAFDLSVLLFSMGMVKYQNPELCDNIASLILNQHGLDKLSSLGLSNFFYGVGGLNLGQVGHKSLNVVHTLLQQLLDQLSKISNNALTHLVFGLSMDVGHSELPELTTVFEEALQRQRLSSYTNSELGMIVCALGNLHPRVGHRINDLIEEIQKDSRITEFTTRDRVRTVVALRSLFQPIPVTLSENWILDSQMDASTPHRLAMDWLESLLHLNQEPRSTLERIRGLVATRELHKMSDSEISELVINLVGVWRKWGAPELLIEVLESIVVLGYVRRLSHDAIYLATSSLRNAKCSNSALIRSLALESTKHARLVEYNEQVLTGVFFNLSALQALDQANFRRLVGELDTVERRSKYRENHIIKILKGLSSGQWKDGLFVNSVLNAFLTKQVWLSSNAVAIILFNLVLLNCWRSPHIERVTEQITKMTNLEHYTLWEIGIILFSFGRMCHYDSKVMELVKSELRNKERVQSGSNQDIVNVVYGLCQLKVDDPSVLYPVLSETLKATRCASYSDEELLKLIKCLSSWEVIDHSQLAGLLNELTPPRLEQMKTARILVLMSSLKRLRLNEGMLMRRIIMALSSPNRINGFEMDQLYEMEYLAAICGAAQAAEKIKKRIKELGPLELSSTM